MRAAAKSIPPPSPARVIVVGPASSPLPAPAAMLDRIAYVDHLGGSAPLRQHDVVVVRSDAQASAERTVELLAGMPANERPRVVVTGEVTDEALHALIEQHEVAHVMAWRGGGAEPDLSVTLEKLLSNDLFGMGRYFEQDSDPARFLCRSATQREELLEWVRTYAGKHRIRSRVMDILLVATDEMITNALYNAPTDGRGNHPYAGISRSVPVTLEGPVPIEIELRCDGQRLGISTVDPFGSLKPEVVLGSLRRCFKKPEPRPGSTGGAGLGLYLLLGSLSHLIFNVALGRRTELIGLMDIAGNRGRAAAAGKSFNLFVER